MDSYNKILFERTDKDLFLLKTERNKTVRSLIKEAVGFPPYTNDDIKKIVAIADELLMYIESDKDIANTPDSLCRLHMTRDELLELSEEHKRNAEFIYKIVREMGYIREKEIRNEKRLRYNI